MNNQKDYIRSELIKRLTRAMLKNQAKRSKEKNNDPIHDKKEAWDRAMKGL